MTLRLRLVLAIVAFNAVALAAFGVAITGAYQRSELRALDNQLGASAGPLIFRLLEPDRSGPHRFGPSDRQPPLAIPAGFVAQLRGADGAVLTELVEVDADRRPALDGLPAQASGRSLATVGSEPGDGSWRVLSERTREPAGEYVVIAVPLGGVTDSVRRLVLLQSLGGLGLLAVLGLGSGLVLRRALRPLESMADAARNITEGDLDRRVAPADGRSEVGQLGAALNTMLDGIQGAFSERDATEAKLRRFLADASHELRTPLTSIQGFAELGRIGEPATFDHGLAFRRIEDEAARMGRLVEDLFLLARLDEHRPLRLAEVDLTVVTADACTIAHASAPERLVTLDAPESAPLVADADLLRQAIANLVVNAFRHAPERSPVEVTTRVDAGGVEVSVRDHGPGFPPDALDKVFDRFWQADPARAGNGSGLGLSIVAAITAEHRGIATATNHAEGGAVVVLRFPTP